MISDVLDGINSLVSIMREESDLLVRPEPPIGLPELASAKIRLAANLEAQLAQLEREKKDWRGLLKKAEKSKLSDALDTLQTVSARNADILRRQMDLSVEMMGAIAAEAKRLAGTRSETYGSAGTVFRKDASMPISINTSL
jgi:hypothetical protein